MNRSSLVKKTFFTACLGLLSWFWYEANVDLYWETVRIECQPKPKIVICQIAGEPSLGGINTEIPKDRLSGVKYKFRAMENRVIQGMVLTTIDDREIPLHRSPKGRILHQLVEYKAKISTFIANSQAQFLNIETTRPGVPAGIISISVGIVIGEYLYLRKLWFGAK